MKILLIANYLPDGQQSMQRFADMLYSSLKKTSHEVQLIRPQPLFCRSGQSVRGLGKWLGYIDKLEVFPYKLIKAVSRADLVHICDHSNSVYTEYLQGIPHLVTCNDLLAIRSALDEFKEHRTRLGGRIYQRMILSGLNKAKHVVCISNATRKDLLRLAKTNPANSTVIYMGLNKIYHPMQDAERNKRLKRLGISVDNPFMLHVGKDNWYKNRLGVLNIFRYMLEIKEFQEFNLVFAGSGLGSYAKKRIEQDGLQNKVFEIISPNDEDLCALYSAAKTLLFPSFYEGFGWPIIEAQACGCPVFTTNRAPMAEAGGEAAVYIDPYEPEEAAYVIVETLENKEKIEEIHKIGFQNAKRFSAEKMAKEYLEVYKTLI